MSKRERISPVDTAWLRMDRPNTLMLIVGAFLIARRMSAKRAFEYRQSGRGKGSND